MIRKPAAPRALAILLLFTWLVMASHSGHAQETARFALGDIPQVMTALLFVEGPPVKRFPIRAIESIKLNNSDTVKKFVKVGFQVRVFRVNEGQDLPGYWATYRFADGDWCDVFLSHILPYPSDGTEGTGYLPLPVFTDLAWLTPGLASLGDGHYLFVFERSNEHGEILRLRRSNSQAYFRSALRVTIEAVGRFSAKDLADVRAYLEENRKNLEPRVRENSVSIRCYRANVSAAAEAERDVLLALVSDCPSGLVAEDATDVSG